MSLAALGLALLAAVSPHNTLAQPAETGVISGSVINAATQKVLERARISVQGTNLTTFTHQDGSFRIAGVPAGVQTLTVEYAGFDDTHVTVTVPAAGTARADVAMTSRALYPEVVELARLEVSAEPEGTAYAIQQEKSAPSLRNVVSADAFGIISDASPGEFLKLIPGIQMDRTGIEPRRMRLRGMEPNLNLVMIDGNQAPAAVGSSRDRAFEFDQITINNIESIEVYKAPIPSMPANAIGGIVNLVTRSAFLQKGRRINASVNVTMNSDAMTLSKTAGPMDKHTRKINLGGSFLYSNSFLDGRLGVVLSLSQVNINEFAPNAARSMRFIDPPPAPEPYPADINFRTSGITRNEHSTFTKRTGGSLNVDFKVSDTTTAYVRTTLADHYYFFASRVWRHTPRSVLPGFSPSRVETTSSGGEARQDVGVGDKKNYAQTINPGMKHRFGDWTIEYDFSHSRATNYYDYLPDVGSVTGAPNFGSVRLTLPNIGFIIEHEPGSAVPTVTQTSGPDMYKLANYRLTGSNHVSTGERSSEDLVRGFKGHVRKDFVARFPFYVEAGGSRQSQKRHRENPGRRWTYVGPELDVQQFAERDYVPDLRFGQRGPDAWVSPFRLAELYVSNPERFVLDEATAYRNAFRSQTIRETITAGYLMGNATFGRLSVLVGARVEETDIEAEGALENEANVPEGVPPNSLEGMIAKLSRTNVRASYTSGPFKYAHLTYRFSDQLQTRASYTEAIGRPNFGSILPETRINESAQTVSINNTELKPQRSGNYDFSVEWYPSDLSSFSVGWFSRDIKDYINRSRTTIEAPNPALDIGPELVGFDLITSQNLGFAKIEGYEISARYQLRSLPVSEMLSGLELFANYTGIYKTEGTFNAGDATTIYKKLGGVADEMFNYGFSYYTPNRKLYLSLRGSYQGPTVGSIDDRPPRGNFARWTYDGEIRYALTPRYSLSLAGRNIFNATEGNQRAGWAARTGYGGGVSMTLTLLGRF